MRQHADFCASTPISASRSWGTLTVSMTKSTFATVVQAVGLACSTGTVPKGADYGARELPARPRVLCTISVSKPTLRG